MCWSHGMFQLLQYNRETWEMCREVQEFAVLSPERVPGVISSLCASSNFSVQNNFHKVIPKGGVINRLEL